MYTLDLGAHLQTIPAWKFRFIFERCRYGTLTSATQYTSRPSKNEAQNRPRRGTDLGKGFAAPSQIIPIHVNPKLPASRDPDAKKTDLKWNCCLENHPLRPKQICGHSLAGPKPNNRITDDVLPLAVIKIEGVPMMIESLAAPTNDNKTEMKWFGHTAETHVPSQRSKRTQFENWDSELNQIYL